jgi:hypothetical protein
MRFPKGLFLEKQDLGKAGERPSGSICHLGRSVPTKVDCNGLGDEKEVGVRGAR